MKTIDIAKNPNQQIGTTIDGVNYTLSFRTTARGMLLADISVDGVLLISGVRCAANALLIPYPHMTYGGNFFWLCTDAEYPDYTKFGDSHFLLYLTDAEIVENEL